LIEVFPIFRIVLTTRDNLRQQLPGLIAAVRSKKGLEIGFRDADDAAEPMNGKPLTLDPAPYGPCRNVEHFGDLLDREKFRDLGAAAIHHASSRMSEVERIGFPSRDSIH
jgi:hypothetical protein